jgi:hypothetical protein
MLSGEMAPMGKADRLLQGAIYILFCSPFLLMGGGMFLTGVFALGPRKDMAELWICLPAGLALLSVFGIILYYIIWRVPSLTVLRFVFDGDEFVAQTPSKHLVIRAKEAIREILEERGQRGRVLIGWWLKIEKHGWIHLERSLPNGEALIDQLNGLLGKSV